MRNKKLALNSISALLFQVTAVLCGFILPRAILNRYGSYVNGLVNSAAQFLQMIAFLELGVGAVLQSALYKPLADRDFSRVSEVIASGNSFFRKLAGILVVYVGVLMIGFPLLVDDSMGFAYSATLIFSMSISYFAQYYFGIVDGLLLRADQKGYIINIIDLVTLVINTILCYCLLYWGFSIQAVKFTTAAIFLLRPILVRYYIRKNYQIDRKCRYTKDPIEQKWNGVAQHVAAIVLDSTDMVILSLFSDMISVSIYSVYLLVVSGVQNLILRFFSGIDALFGELWAKQEREALNKYFGFTEWMIHGVGLFVWCCTYKLIVPFVVIYTEHMDYTNYNVPVFAALICLAYMLQTLRIPFHSIIRSTGHFKNTQNIYIIGASMNVILSVLAVHNWGLVGVTVGTIAAMLYQVLHMGYYVLKHLKVHSFRRSLKQYAVDVLTIGLVLCVTRLISATEATWLGWIVLAVKQAVVIGSCVLVTNFVCYQKETMQIIKKVLKKK